jgi:hypothetical protein
VGLETAKVQERGRKRARSRTREPDGMDVGGEEGSAMEVSWL